MGAKKGPSLPDAPTYWQSPQLQSSLDDLLKYGQSLSRGGFLNASDPNVGFLNQLVSLNPEATQKAVQLASRDVTDMRNTAQQDIINQLAANNQLESSVTANRLSDLNKSYSSDISDIATNFYLADVERSMGNISNLYSMGINTLGNVGSLAQNQENSRNQFNLSNYENQVAQAMASANSGKKSWLQNMTFQGGWEGVVDPFGMFGISNTDDSGQKMVNTALMGASLYGGLNAYKPVAASPSLSGYAGIEGNYSVPKLSLNGNTTAGILGNQYRSYLPY